MLTLTYCRNCFEVMSEPTRAEIIDLLYSKSPRTVTEIVKHFKLRQPTISHHLKTLREAEFVMTQKQGNEVFYSLNRSCHKDRSKECVLLEKFKTFTPQQITA